LHSSSKDSIHGKLSARSIGNSKGLILPSRMNVIKTKLGILKISYWRQKI
jgi:hypothetical protein